MDLRDKAGGSVVREQWCTFHAGHCAEHARGFEREIHDPVTCGLQLSEKEVGTERSRHLCRHECGSMNHWWS